MQMIGKASRNIITSSSKKSLPYLLIETIITQPSLKSSLPTRSEKARAYIFGSDSFTMSLIL